MRVPTITIITIYTFTKTNLNIKFEMDITTKFRLPTGGWYYDLS